MISVGVQGAAGRMGRLLVAGIMEAEDLQLGAMIAPGTCTALHVAGVTCVIGKSMLLRRSELEALGGTWCPNLQLMLGQCDVVSLHVAATAETRGLAGREFFDAVIPIDAIEAVLVRVRDR